MSGLKRCPRCGEDKPREAFSKNVAKRDGLFVYCKSCDGLRRAAYNQNNKRRESDRKRKYIRTPVGQYSNLKSSAKWRRIPMLLTFEEFYELRYVRFNNKCSYCSTSLPETGHGIDRLDNDHRVGYKEENCATACVKCQIERMDNWSPEEHRFNIKMCQRGERARRVCESILDYLDRPADEDIAV